MAGGKKETETVPLIITGEVRTIRLESESANEIVFEATLMLHFENRSSRPVLLFQDSPRPLIGDPILAGSREDAIQRIYLYKSIAWPGHDTSAAWQRLRSNLDQPLPPDEFIRIIGPGHSWDCETKISVGIQKAGSFSKTSKPWDVIRKHDPLWLQVGALTWPDNLEPKSGSTKFGNRLQRRWGKQGQLVLDYLVSEPMPLTLPNR